VQLLQHELWAPFDAKTKVLPMIEGFESALQKESGLNPLT
jgi:hypothetical protein